jgi:hypothetical protein
VLEYINDTARGLLTAISAGAHYVFTGFTIIEDGVRFLSAGLGLNNEAQTLVLLFILAMCLLGTIRLLHGRLRTLLAFLLILILVHALEHIARGPVNI